MRQKRVVRTAFLWNTLVSVCLVGAVLYARADARGALLGGWCVGLAASAAALFCFGRAWASAPNGASVLMWYLLRVAAMLFAVVGAALFSMQSALGAILPQLAQVPLLAAAMLWDDRRNPDDTKRS